MAKKLLLILILLLALPVLASAERQSADTSITVTFGDKKFVNTFEVSWNTEKVYRPYGYGYVEDDRRIILRKTSDPASEAVKILQGPFPFLIMDSILTNSSSIVEIIASSQGTTYRGYIYGAYNTTSLSFMKNGGVLSDSDLCPQGMFLVPKNIRFYPCYYPDKHAEADGAWSLSSDAHLEYVEKYGDWYKTANGTWYSNPTFRELTAEEINSLYGENNPILYRYGDTDPKIGEVQEKLGLPVTCQLDDKTYDKLRFFQLHNGLTIFGSIDQNTLDFLGL